MTKISFKNTGDLTVTQAFEDFLEHCKIKKLRADTIKGYKGYFTIFNRFLDNDAMLISEIDYQTIGKFVLELRSDRHNCNEITVNSYLRGVRVFLYYYIQKDRQMREKEQYKDIYMDCGFVFANQMGNYLPQRPFMRKYHKFLQKYHITDIHFHDFATYICHIAD